MRIFYFNIPLNNLESYKTFIKKFFNLNIFSLFLSNRFSTFLFHLVLYNNIVTFNRCFNAAIIHNRVRTFITYFMRVHMAL